MTQIGHIVIGLIVVVAAIYLIIFVSQRLTARKVAKLLRKKEKLAEIPMRDRLVKGRQLSLTGQSLKQFQLLEGKYGHLETTGFKDIEEQANAVLFESQGLNFVKTAQELKELQQQIRDAETTIEVVKQGLADLEKLDEAHKAAVKELEGKYQELRKTLLSQNFSFGPAIDKLEEILGSLEDDFAEFARLTEAGDHATAAGIYETLGMETNQLEQRIEQIPALYQSLDDTIPGQLAELQDAYDKMDAEGFQFETDIAAELADIEAQRVATVDDLAELTLKKVSESIAQMESRTEVLYETFEGEATAAQQVWENNEQLTAYVVHNKRQNHDLYIELDRLNQDFVFTKDEVGQVRSWEMQLSNVSVGLEELKESIAKHEVVFSTLADKQTALREELERVEHEQVAMWQDLKELPVAVQQSRNRVTLLSDKIRQIQRSFERQGLPGLPKDYMDFFFAVNDELGRLKQQLDLSRINVDDVLRQLSIVTADLDTLQENTDNLVEAASVTERLVRKALSYRDNAEVVQATQQARYYYETDYDYVRAMTTLGSVLDQVEPETTARIINAYRQEQATLQAEFSEQN
ncbi:MULTISPECIES: septation ring formation regulator EzrA [Weissella]|uniref:Septation ring formation regulator EzrA n=1 Tax=Weissella cibaria TaxID=137591 RepID=A0A1X4JJ63_9LACO|nr:MULTISPECIES: septation ring formation regulator EzrA [Weissella]APS26151.1 Septation ring formation regulator EzrA [Weissella cibaria]APU63654.1 Septation ring formation regulator EzrA [Weissella cibaria]APU65804.1 Septation ring formation regulator EzrA [Weissella cibaria]ASS52921.1 Septation ring formation regulator EzrA [Weissella cibaria]AVO66545.1 septation ring formation regulator EzrA [Weissella cibaria]